MTGVVAGAVFRAARRCTGLTQEDLAETTGLSADTVKRWESGQRPLGRVKAAELARIQRHLRALGARPALVGQLPAAIEADEFTAAAIAGDCGQLGSEVMTRSWSSLVGWAVTGEPIAEARDVTVRRPLLATAERQTLLTEIREAATRANGTGTGCLLRHQAYFLTAMDTSPEGSAWLADVARGERRHLRLTGEWSPEWAVARSLAVAVARQGDPEPLRWFIDRHMADPKCDEANLTYWSYWTGSDPETAATEEFMIERPLPAHRGGALLHYLAANLSVTAHPDFELSVATVVSLVRRWPDLLCCDRPLAADLAARASDLLDQRTLPPSTRLALSDLHAAARRTTTEPRRKL
jgi:transcriptional regulator with XRE-family HTH domain